ncbi:hypothetical protein [Candidatus Marimicrobium litorale]|uniref:Uncharacterized protein n=1 Tax=Candidatus Marimicrobium litorale TaxID=2518991 RepID=A0ABT3T8F8_9GAMM|nr:hypothetical protein [Candidatus Marimicrobium litorale]MCX2978563.1 hypothetical protein [Candidatus Marimicrobium litorale]
MINDQILLFVAASGSTPIALSYASSEIAGTRRLPAPEASGSDTIAGLSAADSALAGNARMLDKRTTDYAIHNIHKEN